MHHLTQFRQSLYLLSAVLVVAFGTGSQPAQAASYHLIQVPNSVTAANGPDRAIHGYELSNGKYTTIDYPGAATTEVNGINDSGTILGLYTTTAAGPVHGWIWQNGTFTAIDYPGATDTVPLAISNTGDGRELGHRRAELPARF